MSTFRPVYRMTVYAPRSTDLTEATILTPVTGADHSESFKVATVPGIAGYRPYLEAPMGRKGRIDPLSKRTDTGHLTVRLLDKKVEGFSGELVRWVTAFIGDINGRYRFLKLKTLVEESLDGGATWAAYFTGRVVKMALTKSRLWYDLELEDMADDLKIDCFSGRFHNSVSHWHREYAENFSLIPVGWETDIGASRFFGYSVDGTVVNTLGLFQIAQGAQEDPSLLVTENLASLGLSWATSPSWNQPSPAGAQTGITNPRCRARLHIKTGAMLGQTGEYAVYHFTAVPGAGTGAAAPNPTSVLRVASFYIAELATSDPDYKPMPPAGSVASFEVYDAGSCGELNFVRLGGPRIGLGGGVLPDLHPVKLWQDILDGKFSSMWLPNEPLPPGAAVGYPKFTFPYDTTKFAALRADNTIPKGRFIIDRRTSIREFVEKYICQPYNLAYYLDASGKVIPVDLRNPTSLPSTTITDTDLVTDQSPEWSPDFGGVVTRVDAKRYLDKNIYFADLGSRSGSLPKITSKDFTADAVPVSLLDLASIDLGEGTMTIDGLGYRSTDSQYDLAPDGSGIPRWQWIEQKLLQMIQELRRPFGGGALTIRLRCHRTANTTGLQPGDLRLLTASNVPDPAGLRRGGTRVVRCLERMEDGLILEFLFLDLGVNLTAGVPATPASPTQNPAFPRHVADMTVTLNSAGDAALVQYAITATSVGTRPVATSDLWTFAKRLTAGGSFSIQGLPAGMRIWIRLRSEPDGQTTLAMNPSAWIFPSGNSYIDMATITAPSSLSVPNIRHTSADLTWTPGSSSDLTEIWHRDNFNTVPDFAADLILNGSFETGTLGAQASNWTLGNGNGLLIANDFFQVGSFAGKIINAGVTDSYSYQDVSVTAGEPYEVQGWIRTTALPTADAGTGAYFNIDTVAGITGFTILEKVTIGADPLASQPDCGIAADGVAHDWTFVRCRFIPTGANGTIRLYCQLGYGGGQSGTAWFDSVRILPISPVLIQRVVGAQTAYTLVGLKPSTGQKTQIRHQDPFGGFSTFLTQTFTTAVGDSHGDTHSDVAHIDSAHVDSHSDSHTDTHSDVAHIDQAHTDTHGDSGHFDSHTDSHTDAHTDTHDDQHGDIGNQDTDHTDTHGDEAHADTHDDVHSDSHTDAAHSDSHNDVTHSDTAHTDTHSDVAHADTHTDMAHSDSAHVDTHSDIHTDVTGGAAAAIAGSALVLGSPV